MNSDLWTVLPNENWNNTSSGHTILKVLLNLQTQLFLFLALQRHLASPSHDIVIFSLR